ncbi:13883_t:CDS:2 [Entrophospora sp. SA101]|nr:13883_t:CDS:2 [Entrophospora sp. SA101]
MAPKSEEIEDTTNYSPSSSFSNIEETIEKLTTIKSVNVPLPYFVKNGKMLLTPATNRLWMLAKPFLKLLMDPKRTRPILTVANHLSTVDDPLIWGSLPFKVFLNREKVRWTLGAQELCFITPGAGIYQPAMDFALDRLNDGNWVHVFPEGKINQTLDMLKFKWGIGRLEEIMPEERDRPWIPILGKKMVIAYGNPIDFKDVLINFHEGKTEELSTRIKITDVIFDAMDDLQKKAESLEAGREQS